MSAHTLYLDTSCSCNATKDGRALSGHFKGVKLYLDYFYKNHFSYRADVFKDGMFYHIWVGYLYEYGTTKFEPCMLIDELDWDEYEITWEVLD